MSGFKVLFVIGAMIWMVACGFCGRIMAQPSCENWVGRIVSIQGRVLVKRHASNQWQLSGIDVYLCPGDQLRVGKNSRAAVVLRNDSLLRIDQTTTLIINASEDRKNILIRLLKGMVRFFCRQPRHLKVITPFVNGVVQGTEFLVRVDSDQTRILLFEGRLLAENETGSLSLTRGQGVTAVPGRPLQAQLVVHPREAVQWTLYYPPLMTFRPSVFPETGLSDWQGAVRKSMTQYTAGNLIEAFKAIEGIDDRAIDDAVFFTYRAALHLTVGRVAEAQTDIATAEALAPGGGDTAALKSVIAVTQNRHAEALALAQKAVSADEWSAAAWLASSYANQARFDLDRALDNLRRAAGAEPENALIWARMSELKLATGDMDGALAAARKAAALEPRLPHTLAVLGFANLTRIRLDDAARLFTEAINIDSSSPLPRLGLGLTRIRQGDLAGGRAELEIAAGLAPSNSLIRSYLGKAYFDEKRNGLDARQFEIARQLDPNDPTPWLYDAVRKQSVNQPVAALKALDKSIALNNNRAVYRSRFLLDQDLAVRSANLGRIYSDLKFDLRALAEGWQSVNTDPSNYSAHRFLADHYTALPRHEIARVSEALQAQLLQPLNISPVSPLLAESNLLIRDGMGAPDPAFNEFGRLFNRNRVTLNAAGILGNNSTAGGEIVPSLLWNNFSASAGLYHYESDGFRENNEQEQRITDIFAQVALSPRASLMAQYRNSDKTYGDLPLRFDPDLFFPTDSNRQEASSVRLGGQYVFSSTSRFIGTFVSGNSKATLDIPDFGFSDKIQDDGNLIEGRQHFRINKAELIAGAGYFDAARKETTTLSPDPADIEKSDITQTNIYLYTYLAGPGDSVWTIGAGSDFFDAPVTGSDQFNPKFGVIWKPMPGTTLRGAIFRTLERSLIAGQTIEPTQVAGFNQFFPDAEGTDGRHYGLAWDQRFPSRIYSGIAYHRRDLRVPYEDIQAMDPHQSRNADWTEQTLRGYLYWTPADDLALSTEYRFEELKREEAYPGDALFNEIQTHRFPVGISYFHTHGLIGRLKTTYVIQEGRFGDAYTGFEHGSDQFWVVDTTLSIRLPERFGMVSFEARNMFDQSFNFQDTDPANPDISPSRTLAVKVSLSF